jgi:hypothetical protein
MFRSMQNKFYYNAPNDNAGGVAEAASNNNASADFNMDELFNFSGVEENTAEQPANPTGAGNQAAEQPAGNNNVVDPNAQTTDPMAQQQPVQTPQVDNAVELAKLRGQVEAYQQAIQRPQQPAPQNQQQQAPQRPQFPVRLPPEIVQALSAEDPGTRQQAFEYLGSELGSSILYEAQQMQQNMMRQLAAAIPQVMAQQIAQHSQMQNWNNEFYKEFPQLGATPELKQFVGAVAQQMAQAGMIQDLSANSRRLVAQMVAQKMGVQPRQQQAPQMRRPAMAPGNARVMPNGGQVDVNSPEGILDLIRM